MTAMRITAVGAFLVALGCGSAPPPGESAAFVETFHVLSATVHKDAPDPGAYDEFGARVALSGDTLVVAEPHSNPGQTSPEGDPGVPRVPGELQVFRRGVDGWLIEATIQSPDTRAEVVFGTSLALDGDLLAVGAARFGVFDGEIDGGFHDDAGGVYVFRRVGGAWTQDAFIVAPPVDPDNRFHQDYFGSFSLALESDVLAVPLYEYYLDAGQATEPGAVQIYRRIEGAWTEEAYLQVLVDDIDLHWFGSGVMLSGDMLVVSAPGDDSNATGVNGDPNDNSAYMSGAAYVFRRGDDGWTQEAYLKAPQGESVPFGAVAVDGDTVVAYSGGRVCPFVRGQEVWTAEACFAPGGILLEDEFGSPASLSGTLLAVAARGDASGASGIDPETTDVLSPASGAIYVFERNQEGWTQLAHVKASDNDAYADFGRSLAVDGDLIAVGAPYESAVESADPAAVPEEPTGGVYVFERLPH